MVKSEGSTLRALSRLSIGLDTCLACILMNAIHLAYNAIRAEVAELPTDRRTLLRFGASIGVVLVVVAGVWAWKSQWSLTLGAWISMGAGGALIVIGVARPSALRGVYGWWMLLATVFGFVMTRILLTLVFFIIVTPTGQLMRLFGRDPMNRRPDAALPTYWLTRDKASNDPDRMERYF